MWILAQNEVRQHDQNAVGVQEHALGREERMADIRQWQGSNQNEINHGVHQILWEVLQMSCAPVLVQSCHKKINIVSTKNST